jgi:hypothetical protein
MEHAEVERQEDQDADYETNPMPRGDFNQGKHVPLPRKRLFPHGSRRTFDHGDLRS